MKIPAIDPVKTRKKLGLNQSEFWSPIGVGQSGGSRYESGRNIPPAVRALLAIRYGTEKQRQRMIDELTGVQGG